MMEATLLSPSKAGRVIPKWTSEVKRIWMMGWELSAGEAAMAGKGENSRQNAGKISDLISKNNGNAGAGRL